MKIQPVSMISAVALTVMAIVLPAKGDTANARCDFYQAGASSSASASMPCTFSQRQGYVDIQRQDGVRYAFSPTGSSPGNYVDGNGNAVYRQSGLGDQGQIYRLATESIYVYWNASSSGGNRVGTLTAQDAQARINLRQAATINSRISGSGRVSDRVEILACRQNSDTPGSNLSWCRVQLSRSGAIGWIRSDFIRLDR